MPGLINFILKYNDRSICRIKLINFVTFTTLLRSAVKKTLPILIVSLLFSTGLLSQDYSVNGFVKDASGLPVAYAHVVLLQFADFKQLKGTAADDLGFFELTSVPRGQYYIQVSYIENQSDYTLVKVDSDTDVGTLVLKGNVQNLEEVVVTSQQPRLERKVDRLVFYPGNTAVADGSLWDVLKRTPAVVVTQDKLTVKGSTDIGIMINDRRVNLPPEDIVNLLSGSSASNIEAIEVITSPPAKYSAEGGMLINIKTKKNLISGYNGAIYNRYRQGVFPKHVIGTDHYFKGRKASFSINYSLSDEKEVRRYTDITNFFENNSITSIWTAEQDYIIDRKGHNASVFFDYDIDAENTFRFSTVTSWNPKADRFYDTETSITDTEEMLLSGFDTTNNSDEEQLNTSYYIDYVHKPGDGDGELSFNAHYTYYDYDRGQALATDFFDVDGVLTGENDFTTRSEQQIDLFSIRGDYLRSLGKSVKLETGLRYAGIASESSISQEGFDRDQPGIDPTEAGRFVYDENIYATYLSFDAEWEFWKLKSGLRAEYTETMGDLDISETTSENNYLELFPSFSAQYTPSKKHDFNLYYYRRISRPGYSSINPFQVFQSNFSIIEGNPGLLPATRHYVAGGYTFNNAFTVELFYRNERNKTLLQVFQDNDDQLLRFIHSNLDANVRYGMDFIVNENITNFWSLSFLSSFYQQTDDFTDLDSGLPVTNEQFSWYLTSTSTFSALKDRTLTIDVDFNYFSSVVSGNSRQDSYNELSIFLRKSVFGKRGSISMGLSGIFNQGNIFNTRNFLNQSNSSLYRGENRLFRLGFRYMFGNFGLRTNKKSKKVEEQNRI